MKAALEAEIARLEGEGAKLEAELAAMKAKLEQFCADIPAEFHAITQEAFDKLKGYFA